MKFFLLKKNKIKDIDIKKNSTFAKNGVSGKAISEYA